MPPTIWGQATHHGERETTWEATRRRQHEHITSTGHSCEDVQAGEAGSREGVGEVIAAARYFIRNVHARSICHIRELYMPVYVMHVPLTRDMYITQSSNHMILVGICTKSCTRISQLNRKFTKSLYILYYYKFHVVIRTHYLHHPPH